jgi:hypothetical protein
MVCSIRQSEARSKDLPVRACSRQRRSLLFRPGGSDHTLCVVASLVPAARASTARGRWPGLRPTMTMGQESCSSSPIPALMGTHVRPQQRATTLFRRLHRTIILIRPGLPPQWSGGKPQSDAECDPNPRNPALGSGVPPSLANSFGVATGFAATGAGLADTTRCFAGVPFS